MGKPKKSKHHGARDPIKQREEREQRLLEGKKINNPPKEDQAVSKRFRQFMKLKESASKIGKRRNKDKLITVHDDFADEGIQKKGKDETNRAHLRRVEHLLQKKKQEAEYAKKFNVRIVRDEISGEIKIQKDPLIKANQKKIKQSKEKKEPEEEVSKKKEEDVPEFPLVKYQSAKAKKKLEKEEPILRDFVKFGEVVKEPPTFNLPQKPNAVKKKKKDFLFLAKLNKT